MENLYKYVLRIGDNSLILSHNLAAYSSYGPFLEEDLAISNVALDHLGQADFLLQYAAQIKGEGKTADDLAYKRPEHEYYNCLLAEQPNTDYAYIMARQFLIDAFNLYFFEALLNSSDNELVAIAQKSEKEVRYHIRRSSEWIIRLGDGTDESHQRIQEAINELWMYTGELFEMDEVDKDLIDKGVAPDLSIIQKQWNSLVDDIFQKAKLTKPDSNYALSGGKNGRHTEHLGHMLSDMQYLQRAYPDAKW